MKSQRCSVAMIERRATVADVPAMTTAASGVSLTHLITSSTTSRATSLAPSFTRATKSFGSSSMLAEPRSSVSSVGVEASSFETTKVREVSFS